VRIAALALVAVAVMAACSEPDQQESPSPTARPTVDPLSRWLTEERQERLADTVTTVAKEHGWAVGCVFRWTADETVVDDFSRPTGTAAYSFVNDPELRPAVVVFVEGETMASGSFDEVVPDGVTFCYVPE
jgi:hypothetical protein